MKRKTRTVLASLGLVTILGLFLVFAIPHLLPRVVFFLDTPYAQTQWAQTGKDTQWMFLKKGFHCQVVLVDELPLKGEVLSGFAEDKRTKAMVFSPLLTALLQDTTPQLEQPLSIGMGPLGLGNGFFDIVLTASSDAGWSDAALLLKQKQEETHLISALLYQSGDSFSEEAAKTFETAFADPSLVSIVQGEKSGGEAFVNSVFASLQREHVLLIATPGVDQLDLYLGGDDSVQWVVDVRFAPIVPGNQLFAVIGDNLPSSLEPLIPLLGQRPAKRENPLVLPLLRTCYPRTRTLKSSVESALQALRHSLL
jgi:hypothetical protein